MDKQNKFKDVPRVPRKKKKLQKKQGKYTTKTEWLIEREEYLSLIRTKTY